MNPSWIIQIGNLPKYYSIGAFLKDPAAISYEAFIIAEIKYFNDLHKYHIEQHFHRHAPFDDRIALLESYIKAIADMKIGMIKQASEM